MQVVVGDVLSAVDTDRHPISAESDATTHRTIDPVHALIFSSPSKTPML